MEWSPEGSLAGWTLVDDDWQLTGNKIGATCLGFVCDYLTDPALHREIHASLQVVENRNSANSVISYGKDGDLTGSYREHTEISILAMHLLQSALMRLNVPTAPGRERA